MADGLIPNCGLVAWDSLLGSWVPQIFRPFVIRMSARGGVRSRYCHEKGFVSGRCAFFCQLGPFLVDPARLVLMRDWNARLDPKLNNGWEGSKKWLIVAWLIDTRSSILGGRCECRPSVGRLPWW